MVKCTVKVPATTANLGPGFDSVGCAFSLYNIISFALSDKLEFSGCDQEYANENNLSFISFKAVYEFLGKEAPFCHISFESIDIPLSRGLGSSASLIVAGSVAANSFLGNPLSKEDILGICNKIEGHPDNLSPAIYGGLTASLTNEGKPYSISYKIHNSLKFVALVPDFELLTKYAREILPKNVSLSDAVFNSSHLAVLLKALETGNKELITVALDDKLHQPYRKSLIKGYENAQNIAKDLGCISFFISGAGPTCLCITDKDGFAEEIKTKLNENSLNWQVIPLDIDFEGATII